MPSPAPSHDPSPAPSAKPTELPTDRPSTLPSRKPSPQPSSIPTGNPSSPPTNIDGVTGQCADDTLALNGAETIDAELVALKKEVESLNFTDYCESPGTGQRRCVIDYDELEHNVRYQCELLGGHYSKSYYKAECKGESTWYDLGVQNEPGCSGNVCDDNEKSILLRKSIEERVSTSLETSGLYQCEVTYFRTVAFEVELDASMIIGLKSLKRSQSPSESPTSMPTTTAEESSTEKEGQEEKKTSSASAIFQHCRFLLPVALALCLLVEF